MKQEEAIEILLNWLLQNRWSDYLKIKCDHIASGEELPLFIGPKRRRKGQGCRVSETDILAFREDTRTVDLIVEVDLLPNPTPKRVFSNLMPALIADNYTPSYLFTPYKLERTLVACVFVLDGPERSQKKVQFQHIEERIQSRFDLPAFGIRDIRLCHGQTVEEALASFQSLVRTYFLGL
jgi:hypothetical protein